MQYDVLAHYGILGMKWGVRRSEAQLSRARIKTKKLVKGEDENKKRIQTARINNSASEATSKRYIKTTRIDKSANKNKIQTKKIELSEDAKAANKIRNKSVEQMSNAELKTINERVRLEQEYSRLNPSTVQKGWKYVVGATAVTGTALALYNNSNNLVNIGKRFIGR